MPSLLNRCLNLDRASLLESLAAVSSIVPTRSPKPVLQKVLLRVDPDAGATLSATDLGVSARHRVLGIKSEAPLRFLLPPAKFGQMLREAADESVVLELDDPLMHVRGLRWEHKIQAEDPDTYPTLPDFPPGGYHEVAAADLLRLIRRTAFATDVESIRYALGGTLLEAQEGTLALVGTDGRRLARQEVPAEPVDGGGARPGAGSPVVPVKALRLIERVVAPDDAPVHLAWDSSGLHARTERCEVYARLVEGRYPRYQDVFPAGCNTRARTTAGELLHACRQVALATSDESRGVDFAFEEGMLTLSAQAADVGSGRFELPIGLEGPACMPTLDVRYLLDALKALEADQVLSIEILDDKNAVLFKAEDQYVYVVMSLTRDR